MEITKKQILAIMPNAKSVVDKYLGYLNEYCPKYGINTPRRMRYFLAQIAHESMELRSPVELSSGKQYDTGRKAQQLGNTTQADGDGQRYKGRGLIQLTGTYNYKAASKALGYDFLKDPKALQQPKWATMSACWFWQSHGLNELADKDEFTKVTRIINGGTTHMDERREYLRRANASIK